MSDTIYTVVKGDTATKITKKFNISLDVFKKLNPTIKDVNKLSIGQKVKVAEEVVAHIDDENEYTAIEDIDWAIKMPDGSFKFDLKDLSDDDLSGKFYEVHTLENGQKTLLPSGYLDKLAQTQVVKVYGATPILLTLYINNDWIDAKPIDNRCYCNGDFTVNEVKNIVQKLRYSKTIQPLFNHKDCELSSNDRTYERFTEELNNTCKKYAINTCIKKIHFLAQIFHESAKLTTTSEFGDGKKYDPGQHKDAIKNGNTKIGDGSKYKGRGLMQLTWKNNYMEYQNYSGTECIHNYSIISNNLHFALDSAGWFWTVFKKANFGTKKNKLKYKIILGKSLNLVAEYDDKYLEIISKLVNGGGNGMKERKEYFKQLKSIFELKSCNNV